MNVVKYIITGGNIMLNSDCFTKIIAAHAIS